MANIEPASSLAAMKLILPKLAAGQPHISVMALAKFAVDDHIRTNGCEFEPDAAVRAVERSGFDPNVAADSLTKDELNKLGDLLEDMETNCPHKGEKIACVGAH